MTPSEFKKLFHSEQYDYFKSLGFDFAIMVNSLGKKEIIMANNIGEPSFGKIVSKFSHNGFVQSDCGKESFVRYSSSSLYRHTPSVDNVEKNNLDFFCQFYNKYPEHQQKLLKDYWQYFTHFSSIENRLFDITSNLMENKQKKEIAEFIINFPTDSWGTITIDLTSVVKFLEEKNFNTDEVDDFLFKFIKTRKKELKEPIEGVEVRDFLFNRYGSNSPITSKYLGFSPFLKAYFKKPEIDFLEKESEFSTVIKVNTKKMQKSFLIDNWGHDKYSNALHFFCDGIKKIYNLSVCQLVDADIKPRNFPEKSTEYNILALHDESTFTKELLKKTLTDFFIHLQNNLNFDITVPNIEKWVEKYELHKELSQLPIKESRVNKASKI